MTEHGEEGPQTTQIVITRKRRTKPEREYVRQEEESRRQAQTRELAHVDLTIGTSDSQQRARPQKRNSAASGRDVTCGKSNLSRPSTHRFVGEISVDADMKS